MAVLVYYEGINYEPFEHFIKSLNYFGTLLGGFLYAYGFTSAPATAILLVLSQNQNIFLSAVIGGIGALISDVLIFLFIRASFADEIKMIKKEKIVKKIAKTEKRIFGRIYKYILPVFSGFLIASPLPTEIGVSLMASIKKLSVKKFMIAAYILHTLGIFLIFLLGKSL
jgi:uncharacterized membrane protein YdjX (TVP38/TMEM64 family)